MIRMSPTPLEIGSRYYGDRLEGDVIIGKPFKIVAVATREEFVSQFAPGEMTPATDDFLSGHPVLYFYRTEPLNDLIQLLSELCEEERSA